MPITNVSRWSLLTDGFWFKCIFLSFCFWCGVRTRHLLVIITPPPPPLVHSKSSCQELFIHLSFVLLYSDLSQIFTELLVYCKTPRSSVLLCNLLSECINIAGQKKIAPAKKNVRSWKVHWLMSVCTRLCTCIYVCNDWQYYIGRMGIKCGQHYVQFVHCAWRGCVCGGGGRKRSEGRNHSIWENVL